MEEPQREPSQEVMVMVVIGYLVEIEGWLFICV